MVLVKLYEKGDFSSGLDTLYINEIGIIAIILIVIINILSIYYIKLYPDKKRKILIFDIVLSLILLLASLFFGLALRHAIA